MSRTVVVNGCSGFFFTGPGLSGFWLDDYFRDRYNPTEQELEMFKVVTGMHPILLEGKEE